MLLYAADRAQSTKHCGRNHALFIGAYYNMLQWASLLKHDPLIPFEIPGYYVIHTGLLVLWPPELHALIVAAMSYLLDGAWWYGYGLFLFWPSLYCCHLVMIQRYDTMKRAELTFWSHMETVNEEIVMLCGIIDRNLVVWRLYRRTTSCAAWLGSEQRVHCSKQGTWRRNMIQTDTVSLPIHTYVYVTLYYNQSIIARTEVKE